ncbi:hypothetical protein OUZ56_016125 [Daphnia magna]|uniref:Uncharacterized protein n=1 Tax=Daphnia magna TaxID=35525 RepID=A0ABR0APT9_9CRUS|nr:hypothetical protein OUZ56_016125 [Daphnia magna]
MPYEPKSITRRSSLLTILLLLIMDLSTSDEDMPHLIYEGRILIESRDTFGSPIWIDRLDLNCYSQGARGTPRGSLTCRSHNVLRGVHCCRLEGECVLAPGGEHNHREPVTAEVRYLRVRYLARVFCVEGRSAIGLTAYLGELTGIYHLPWTQREVMLSMKDMAATCARTGRIWPHTMLWADRESPERALHYERLRAAQGRRDARIAIRNQREQYGNGVQAPKPVAGFDPEILVLEGAAPVIQGQELVGLIGGLAPGQFGY